MIRACAVLCFLVSSWSLRGATVTISNLSDLGNGAHGVRDASGVLVNDAVGFRGAMGYFTITDSQISSSFSGGDFAGIASGFQMFDPIAGFFTLNSFAAGAFQSSETFDTKVSSNSFGGQPIYVVLFRGAALASATELLVAKLTDLFPTDPEIGAPLPSSTALRPSKVGSLVVGSVGATHDYGFGSGPLTSYQLAAVPEPSRALLLLGGVAGLMMRRRRV